MKIKLHKFEQMNYAEPLDDKQQLATEFILKTAVNVFVTGKAGTGKTTFLRNIQHNTLKKTAVAAPTGVAAINAGGMTLHSLFQLPFQAFIPSKQRAPSNFVNQHTLFEKFKFSKPKIELIRELELLIIDEVSMLRADTLDCIDFTLRTIRKNQLDAFGGVQVLFIGDLFQLPPVVKDEEWHFLKEFYDSPFFFHAKVIQEAQFFNIEFDKIYRQNEENFIQLLNKVRNNEMIEEDYYLLNERYQPELIPDLEDYITLTTHNYKADKINQAQLQKIEEDITKYEAQISGDFYENSYPTELTLQLKRGAQIMFIRNDSNPEKKYYNGKLATVVNFTDDGIVVQFLDNGEEYTLGTETWENIRYSYNSSTDKIEEEKLGSFTQFPVRLAWAITIHKSQGLTFDKAIIDAGQAFAPGQVYVALSRCTTLQGLYLMTQIFGGAIKSDERIIDFTESNIAGEDELIRQLPFHKIEFAKAQLIKAFDWNKLTSLMSVLVEITEEKSFADKDTAMLLFKSSEKQIRDLHLTAQKFSTQLQEILNQIEQPNQQELLQERVLKSILYFGENLSKKIIEPMHDFIHQHQNKKGMKGYLKKVDEVNQAFLTKLHQLEKLQFGDTFFYVGQSFFKIDHKSICQKINQKTEKGESHRESLRMYQDGKSIEEIAHARNLAITTIESHISQYIKSGEVDIFKFINEQDAKDIQSFLKEMDGTQLSPLKQHFGERFTFGQLKMAVAYLT